MKKKLALAITVVTCAFSAPAAHAYPLDPGTGDRLDVPTTSRTSQGVVTKPKKHSSAKKNPLKPRPKPPLEP